MLFQNINLTKKKNKQKVDLQGLEQQLDEKKSHDEANRQMEQKYVQEEKRRAEVLRLKSEELQQVITFFVLIKKKFTQKS